MELPIILLRKQRSSLEKSPKDHHDASATANYTSAQSRTATEYSKHRQQGKSFFNACASDMLKDYNADNQDDADHWSGLG